MYLISAYFDEQTRHKMTHYMNRIAEKTGNTFMTANHVPPHITISAVEVGSGEEWIPYFRSVAEQLSQGMVQLVSVGMFLPYVIYAAPVLNEYLQKLSEQIYQAVCGVEGVQVSKYYQPMQWFPHVTLGKTLSKEEMRCAFEVMQNCFVPFEGRITSLGLARTKPYEELLHISIDEFHGML